jgi:hypothetical protein
VQKSSASVLIAVLVTAVTLGLGYASFGFLTMLVFTAGFLGGLLLWLVLPSRGTWGDIRWPFWLSLVLFFAHRVEEKQLGFFAMLSEVTGVPTPPATSPPVLLLVGTSVGAWLLVPVLMKRRHQLGAYFAWTFFASMGLTELAHYLVFPFLRGPGYHFVPGMLTVPVLAPVAWLGMWRLATTSRRPAENA